MNQAHFSTRTRTRLAATATAALTALAIATPALANEFPLLAHDLNPGERVVTTVHGTSDPAQTGAKDLRVLRRVADNNWTPLKEGESNLGVNSNYLIYDQPVYAMAAGKVIGCWRNAPENAGNVLHAQVNTRKILLQGNHLWIQQNDGRIALYAHARTGNISATLCPNNNSYLTGTALNYPHWTQPEATVANGATVSAGQLLFRAGNSGNSSEPHLHMHVVDTWNNWQPMTFARGQTTSFSNNTASLDGPWTRLQGNVLPSAKILVWPPHPVGNWTYNGISAAAYQRVFDHFVDSGVMLDTVTCTNNGASFDTTWVPAHGYWISHHAMSSADYAAKNQAYTQQGYRVTSAYACGSVVAAVWRKP
jgi:hypothetical protein